MSVDTSAGDGLEREAQFACAICCAPAGDDARHLATYPTDESVGLAPAAADGLLALCGDCTAEVTELTAAWVGLERPPVGSTDSIAADYVAVAGECSFCDGTVDGSLLGVDVWNGAENDAGAALAAHDNYALCESCVGIFEEFLRGITPE